MTNYNFITRDAKLFMVFSLLFLGNWTSFSDYEKSAAVDRYFAYADDNVGWAADVTDADLLGNENYDIYNFSKVYINRGGELEEKVDYNACVNVNDVNAVDGFGVFVVFFETPTSASLNDVYYCHHNLTAPKPISQKGNVLVLFDNNKNNSIKIQYNNYLHFLTLSYSKKDFISLLRDNKHETLSLSFPVDTLGEVDSIDVKFNSKNLNNVLSKIDK